MVTPAGMVSGLAIVGVWVKVAVAVPTVVAGLMEITPMVQVRLLTLV